MDPDLPKGRDHPSLSVRPALVTLALLAATLVAACENPQPPNSCGTVPEQTIHVGESATVSVCFGDPNEDMLIFATTSSDPGVATVAGTGSTVTVAAVSPGTAVVTMTATDPGGLMAQQSFRVVVPNRAPAAVGTIADRELMVGDSATLDVAAHFSEPDGQPLTYAVAVAESTRLTASVLGSTVTLVALAKGTVAATVTATDPGGLTAIQTFQVTVPNRAPVALDSIPARTIEVDQADTLDVSPFFADPDGDTLSYTVAVSDSAKIAASVSGNTIILSALAKGEAVVTVTATDNEELSAAHIFRVTVPNRPPVATDSIPARTLFTYETDTLELTLYFTDPDGDPLTWAAETSGSGVVTVDGPHESGRLTVTAIMPGEVEVSVIATDSEGLSAQQHFRVVVPNRPPSATGTIPERELMVGDSATLDISTYFSEPDGQALTYRVTTTDSTRFTASVQGATVTLAAVAKGTVLVTVTATDPGGLMATQAFQVTIPNRAPVALDAIPPRTIEVDQADTLDVSPFFADPDGDRLAYSAAVSDNTRLAASVSGNALTVTALAKGVAEITVTATDNEGASAAHTFQVTVANRPPVAADSFLPLTLFKDATETLQLTPHFADPDGDSLAWAAEASNSSVVAVTVSRAGGTLTVTAIAQGETAVTVTATDDEGLTAQQSFQVTVPNRAPAAGNAIPVQTLFRGRTVPLDLTRHFTDPDGDILDFAAETTDITVATGTIEGAILTIQTKADGEATITVTAADPAGLTAQQSFTVTVLNRAPTGTTPIPDQTINEGRSETLGMSPHFEDPDDDPLTYTASTSNSRVATVRVSRSNVTVRGVLRGEAEITVTATDPDGASIAQSFTVTVERLTMDFDIGLAFGPNVSPSQERVFRSAASYWQSALRFTELADVAVNETLSCSARGVTANVTIETLDDVGIVFAVADLDGEQGTLAVARLCFVRSESRTPVLGLTVFDRADIDRLAQEGNLQEVTVHEIAHILGFGLLWERSGLLRDPSEVNPDADTHFAGTRAIACVRRRWRLGLLRRQGAGRERRRRRALEGVGLRPRTHDTRADRR